eukprot:TRINITY_DN4577_c0_g1_i2.p1 TRINITY_DN4577_c0_g1~~TRINITY_DN4577_c0_g1_i2.p1  ORF type:complete len:1857 (+),score=625.71 TRINITY_DN4577_c0_g1_i2:148-5718(+)
MLALSRLINRSINGLPLSVVQRSVRPSSEAQLRRRFAFSAVHTALAFQRVERRAFARPFSSSARLFSDDFPFNVIRKPSDDSSDANAEDGAAADSDSTPSDDRGSTKRKVLTVKSLLARAQSKGLEDIDAYRNVLEVLAEERRWKRMEELLADMDKGGVAFDAELYHFVITTFVQIDHLPPALKYFARLQADPFAEADPRTLTVLLHALLNSGQPDMLRTFLSELLVGATPLSQPTFETIVDALAEAGQVNAFLPALRQLQARDGEISDQMVAMLIAQLGRVGRKDVADQCFDLRMDFGSTPTAPVYNAVIGVLDTPEDFERLLARFDEMQTLLIQPDRTTYLYVIRALTRADRHREALEMFLPMLRSEAGAFAAVTDNTAQDRRLLELLRSNLSTLQPADAEWAEGFVRECFALLRESPRFYGTLISKLPESIAERVLSAQDRTSSRNVAQMLETTDFDFADLRVIRFIRDNLPAEPPPPEPTAAAAEPTAAEPTVAAEPKPTAEPTMTPVQPILSEPATAPPPQPKRRRAEPIEQQDEAERVAARRSAPLELELTEEDKREAFRDQLAEASETGRTDKLAVVLKRMRKAGISLDEEMYFFVIRCHNRAGETEAALGAVLEMAAAMPSASLPPGQLSPAEREFRSAARLLDPGDMPTFARNLYKAGTDAFPARLFEIFLSALGERRLLLRFTEVDRPLARVAASAILKAGQCILDDDLLTQWLNRNAPIGGKSKPMTREDYNELLSRLADRGETARAKHLFTELTLPHVGPGPDPETFYHMIRLFDKAGDVAEVLNYYKAGLVLAGHHGRRRPAVNFLPKPESDQLYAAALSQMTIDDVRLLTHHVTHVFTLELPTPEPYLTVLRSLNDDVLDQVLQRLPQRLMDSLAATIVRLTPEPASLGEEPRVAAFLARCTIEPPTPPVPEVEAPVEALPRLRRDRVIMDFRREMDELVDRNDFEGCVQAYLRFASKTPGMADAPVEALGRIAKTSPEWAAYVAGSLLTLATPVPRAWLLLLNSVSRFTLEPALMNLDRTALAAVAASVASLSGNPGHIRWFVSQFGPARDPTMFARRIDDMFRAGKYREVLLAAFDCRKAVPGGQLPSADKISPAACKLTEEDAEWLAGHFNALATLGGDPPVDVFRLVLRGLKPRVLNRVLAAADPIAMTRVARAFPPPGPLAFGPDKAATMAFIYRFLPPGPRTPTHEREQPALRPEPSEAEKRVSTARSLLKAGDHKGALSTLLAVVRESPAIEPQTIALFRDALQKLRPDDGDWTVAFVSDLFKTEPAPHATWLTAVTSLPDPSANGAAFDALDADVGRRVASELMRWHSRRVSDLRPVASFVRRFAPELAPAERPPPARTLQKPEKTEREIGLLDALELSVNASDARGAIACYLLFVRDYTGCPTSRSQFVYHALKRLDPVADADWLSDVVRRTAPAGASPAAETHYWSALVLNLPRPLRRRITGEQDVAVMLRLADSLGGFTLGAAEEFRREMQARSAALASSTASGLADHMIAELDGAGKHDQAIAMFVQLLKRPDVGGAITTVSSAAFRRSLTAINPAGPPDYFRQLWTELLSLEPEPPVSVWSDVVVAPARSNDDVYAQLNPDTLRRVADAIGRQPPASLDAKAMQFVARYGNKDVAALAAVLRTGAPENHKLLIDSFVNLFESDRSHPLLQATEAFGRSAWLLSTKDLPALSGTVGRLLAIDPLPLPLLQELITSVGPHQLHEALIQQDIAAVACVVRAFADSSDPSKLPARVRQFVTRYAELAHLSSPASAGFEHRASRSASGRNPSHARSHPSVDLSDASRVADDAVPDDASSAPASSSGVGALGTGGMSLDPRNPGPSNGFGAASVR